MPYSCFTPVFFVGRQKCAQVLRGAAVLGQVLYPLLRPLQHFQRIAEGKILCKRVRDSFVTVLQSCSRGVAGQSIVGTEAYED